VIVVAGEALVDLVEEGNAARSAGGGPFNTAIALADSGFQSPTSETLSRDDYGGVLAGLLAVRASTVGLVRATDAPTR